MFKIRSSIARYIGACLWLLGVSFLLAGAAAPVRAQGPPKCEEQAVKDALTQVLSTPRADDGTLVLAYDHRKATEWWKAYEWKGGCLNLLTSQDDRFEVRPEDRPRLTLKKGTPVRVVVVRTNPLLYTTTAGESSEEDQPDLAAMQQLAGLLSGVAVASVRAAGVRSAAANADTMLTAAVTASNDKERHRLLGSLGAADKDQVRRSDQLIKALDELGNLLDGSTLEDREKALKEAAREFRMALVDWQTAVTRLQTHLRDEQKDGFPQAPFYEALKQRYGEATSWASVQGLTCGVIELSRAQGEKVDVRWSKVRTESAMIKADDRVKKLVDLDRPTDFTIKYELARKSVWQNLDVNLGVIYTDVANPVFSAVADPEEMTAAAATTTGDDKPDPVLRIRQTDEETRAGDLALFATWNFWEPKEAIPLGVQIGASTDTDHPDFFAGLSVGLGTYVRLSGGYSWHQVKELDGQSLGDVVASEDAIQTRDHFDDGPYLALTIAIDELPFFKPKEKD